MCSPDGWNSLYVTTVEALVSLLKVVSKLGKVSSSWSIIEVQNVRIFTKFLVRWFTVSSQRILLQFRRNMPQSVLHMIIIPSWMLLSFKTYCDAQPFVLPSGELATTQHLSEATSHNPRMIDLSCYCNFELFLIVVRPCLPFHRSSQELPALLPTSNRTSIQGFKRAR